METPDTLKKKLNCNTDDELGALFFVGFKAVSAWRRNGVPNKILKRAEAILDERKRAASQETKTAKETISDQHTANGYDLPPDEQELLARYRRLDKQHRFQLMEILICYEGFCRDSRHVAPLATDSTESGYGQKSSGGAGG